MYVSVCRLLQAARLLVGLVILRMNFTRLIARRLLEFMRFAVAMLCLASCLLMVFDHCRCIIFFHARSDISEEE